MLRERLEKAGRLAWVTEEMAALTDPALYDVDPENAWKRLKPRKHTAKYLAVFKAVAAWRERTAQTRDQPRGRILKDEAIDEIATQAPTDADGAEPAALGAQGLRRLALRPGPARRRSSEALKDPEAYAPVIERSHDAAVAGRRRGGRAAEGAAEGAGRGRRRGLQADRHRLRPGEDRQRRRGRRRRPCRAGGARRSARTR